MKPLTRYLVGGAVRDTLLGRPVKDRDWVVLRETPASMLARGFKPVGADFPVFLHPETGEEHALARQERSTGARHADFAVETDGVTLGDDLRRRDLTINAMAMSEDGEVIDPFGGRQDLERRWLRHVGPAFEDDPLRVLRVARFAAELPGGFRVAPATLLQMLAMVRRGDLAALTAERVFQEANRALLAPAPVDFFVVLREAAALAVVLPEVDALRGVPEHPEWHPEGETFDHVILVLEAAARLDAPDPEPWPALRWAALCHDLGKAETPADKLPLHPGHEKASERLARGLLTRLRAPADLTDSVATVCREHMRAKRYAEMRPGKVLRLLESLGALRRPTGLGNLPLLLDLCKADDLGRGMGSRKAADPETFARRERFFYEAHAAAQAIQGRDALASRPGKEPGTWVGQVVTQMRVGAIARATEGLR